VSGQRKTLEKYERLLLCRHFATEKENAGAESKMKMAEAKKPV